MLLRFLGKGGSDRNGCPTLYATDRQTYIVQAWKTEWPGTVELPHLLLGFAEPDTFIGTQLTDTGRGTFLLTGEPVSDSDALSQMVFQDNETAIAVPMTERSCYGGVLAR